MNDRTDPKSLTVYLLEQAAAIRLRQLRMLQNLAGVQVTGTGTDAEAEMPTLVALRPDVVLIGLHAAQNASLARIRILACALPGSTLIVLTNNGMPQMRKACLKAGGSYCFDKTLEVAELRATLQKMAGTVRRPGNL